MFWNHSVGVLVSREFGISLQASLLGTDGVLQMLLPVLQVSQLLLHHHKVSMQALQLAVVPDRWEPSYQSCGE